MYTIKGSKDFEIEIEDQLAEVGGEEFEGKVKHVNGNKYLLIKNDEVIEIELLSLNKKSITIKLKGVEYSFEIEDELDRTIQKMGLKDVMGAKVSELKAPMPGLIVEIKVKEGQEVKKGETLIILEAMKMENTIKADHDGVVEKLMVKEKDSVEKNQLLIRF